ncbi:eukaryotic translation initiation factor 5B-like [Oppia nitens]|uniref:eukaryotic translation initiation factor 5B-like n=1 Tax=Oppia nitens TaxID=1686743 RepID=UPI0023DA2AB9|nr:eukaryotic translation initiation factor 5B-like [Oppia nitens]
MSDANGGPVAVITAAANNNSNDSKSKNKKKKPTAKVEDTTKGDNNASDVKKITDNKQAVKQQESTTKEPAKVNDDNNGGADGEDKKDPKKKKKKPAAKEPAKKEAPKKAGGGPSKKMLALMKESLAKQKDEEERLEREEEERIKQEEELERQRLEKLKREQEKKDKKKQKDKERKERLKKEGKLLNPKQKADKQRAQASLAALLKGGQIIVGKQKSRDKDDTINKSDGKVKSLLEPQLSEEKSESAKDDDDVNDAEDGVSEDSSDDVKENWEESSGDEEDESESEISEEKVKKVDTKTENNKKQEIKRSESITKGVKDISINEDKSLADDIPKRQFRSPVVCVLGHVDTGKTKLLDYIRKSHVQDGEAGGITQQIGATYVPPSAIHEQTKGVKEDQKKELLLPGLLIIDTPGHESFSNLRSRGSSLCDIAILVIDIMHGLEPQTIESINLLKSRKTPFIVALNKIDRLYEWRSNSRKDVQDVINSQITNTKLEFKKRAEDVILQLAEQSINAALYYDNQDFRSYVSLVPTSAHSGDGMGNLISLLISLTQTLMAKKVAFDPINLDATVLEVKAIPGLGTTIDVILVNGRLKEGDKIVLAGHDGPFVTHIRSILVPQPLRELRIKTPYQELKVVYGSMGVKIAAHDLDKAIAGLQLLVAENEPQIESHKRFIWNEFGQAMKSIKCTDKGVYVQASTLGSLEALLEFLKSSKIPYCGVRIGPVVKRDVMKASIMLESAPDYAVILAFDVRIERDAQEMADQLGVKIFSAEIIYHLFDKFTAYKDDLRKQRREANKHLAVFPCKLRILPNCVFNTRDPIVVGVSIEEGVVVPGTPLAVPSKQNLEIGKVTSIEVNHKHVESARKGQEVCLRIEHFGSDAPKLYGRHFDHQDLLVSRLTRESIDCVKEYFREDLQKTDWQLIIELKKVFEII